VPPVRPPASAPVPPNLVTMPARTVLWRVHRRSRSGVNFKDVLADRNFGGNRFDSTAGDPFSFLYAAPQQETALLETLVRSIPFNARGERLLRRSVISGVRISAAEPVTDLTLISLLTHQDLAAACQDEWLVQAPPAEYPQTRRWAQWLRSQAPLAQGLVWLSVRNLGSQSVVLFGDRCPDGALQAVPGAAVDLDTADGEAWLNEQLAPYRISVRPPSKG
jgi:RES domain